MSDIERSIRLLVAKVREEARAEARAELLSTLNGGKRARSASVSTKRAPRAAAAPRIARKGFRDVLRSVREEPAPRTAVAKSTGGRRRSPTDVAALVEQARVFVSDNPGCKRAEIARALGLLPSMVGRPLMLLRESGAVTVTGTRAGARYTSKP